MPWVINPGASGQIRNHGGSKCFTMDVCLINNQWKIVECGSVACAGFYDADTQKIIMGLEEAFNDEVAHPSYDGLYIKNIG